MAVSVQALRGVHDGQRSFTVVDSDALPISSVETFLRHLEALGYSPNTVKAYAHDLADLFNWVRFRRRDWRTLTVADVGEWVAWLGLPGPARQGRVLLSVLAPCRSPARLEWTGVRCSVDVGGSVVSPATGPDRP